MTIILYPNNCAYAEDDIRFCIGTHETFQIPEVRGAPSLKHLEETQTYYFNGHTIKAFYNALDSEAIRQRELEYNREYQQQHRKPRYSDMKKSAMLIGLAILLNQGI